MREKIRGGRGKERRQKKKIMGKWDRGRSLNTDGDREM